MGGRFEERVKAGVVGKGSCVNGKREGVKARVVEKD